MIVSDPWYRFLKRYGAQHSLEFRSRVEAVFAKRLQRVSVRPPGTADDDIVYMARARYLVPSKGGFSALAMEAALRNNGSVFWRKHWKGAV